LVLIFLNCFLDLELDVPPAAEITASLAETRIKKILFGGDIFFATIINRFVILPFQINLQNLTRACSAHLAWVPDVSFSAGFRTF
jgi:hypothetical protein